MYETIKQALLSHAKNALGEIHGRLYKMRRCRCQRVSPYKCRPHEKLINDDYVRSSFIFASRAAIIASADYVRSSSIFASCAAIIASSEAS
jgi:hypothetical protein